MKSALLQQKKSAAGEETDLQLWDLRDPPARAPRGRGDARQGRPGGGLGGRPGRRRGSTSTSTSASLREAESESESDTDAEVEVDPDPDGRPRLRLRRRLVDEIFQEDEDEEEDKEEPEAQEGDKTLHQRSERPERCFKRTAFRGAERCSDFEQRISSCIRSSKLRDWMPIRDEVGKRYLTRFCAIEGWDVMLHVIQMVFFTSRGPRTVSDRFLRYLQGRFPSCEVPWSGTRRAPYSISGLIAESIRHECAFMKTHLQRMQERAPHLRRFAETFIGIPLTLIFFHLEIITEAECETCAVVLDAGFPVPGGDDSSSEDGDFALRAHRDEEAPSETVDRDILMDELTILRHVIERRLLLWDTRSIALLILRGRLTIWGIDECDRVRPSRLPTGKLTPMKDFISEVRFWAIMDRLLPWLTEWSVDSSPTPDFVLSQRTRIDGADPIEGLHRFGGQQPSEADRRIIWRSVSRAEG
ncbi:hypothetical protein R1sor_016734 [Riccia sorocarpa]|uniref:Uncharacterized protein n=1 Tax=Riccia sorocarpa TaxID=122646 RepID=A0ABD3HK01_9MARC